ncbi:hypothetical protein HPG69_012156, partial [Diceros bicornis minor]
VTSGSALHTKLMDGGNHSVVSEFLLWDLPILGRFRFFVFCFSHVIGNLIVLTNISDHHLHSHMCLLLANLSFTDTSCITLMLFIHTVVGTEVVLFIIMSYD